MDENRVKLIRETKLIKSGILRGLINVNQGLSLLGQSVKLLIQ
ncbi:unnamed protein product, partial [marine sediment metagenome]